MLERSINKDVRALDTRVHENKYIYWGVLGVAAFRVPTLGWGDSVLRTVAGGWYLEV